MLLCAYQLARSYSLYSLRSTSIPMIFGHIENDLFSPHSEPTFKPYLFNLSQRFNSLQKISKLQPNSIVYRLFPHWEIDPSMSAILVIFSICSQNHCFDLYLLIWHIPNIKMLNQCLFIESRYSITLLC